MKINILSWLYTAIRCVIALIFIYAGGSKLTDVGAFSEVIGSYGLIPESMISLFAVILPTVEILAGIGLLFDLSGSLAIIAFLLLLFVWVLAYAIQLGFDIDCGCFSPGDHEARVFHELITAIAQEVVMIGCIAYLYAWRINARHSKLYLELIQT